MKRLVALTLSFVLLPASIAYASDLDELLEPGRDASYSAEQVITCSTPEGVRDAVVHIAQSGDEIRVAAAANEDMQIASGYGRWTMSDGSGVISSAQVDAKSEPVEAVYTVEAETGVRFLGRPATSHRLIRDGVHRASLILDVETSAIVSAVTYSGDGSTYCERRFVSFDPTDPGFGNTTQPAVESIPSGVVETSLPTSVAGFSRLDLYEDDEGFRFAYYSDGFFSFAVFETPVAVVLPEGVVVELGGSDYRRLFTAGQVTYVWENTRGGLALVGDVPPDMHGLILADLPLPRDPGLFRRLWRNLFG
jgi:hypothetical protein